MPSRTMQAPSTPLVVPAAGYMRAVLEQCTCDNTHSKRNDVGLRLPTLKHFTSMGSSFEERLRRPHETLHDNLHVHFTLCEVIRLRGGLELRKAIADVGDVFCAVCSQRPGYPLGAREACRTGSAGAKPPDERTLLEVTKRSFAVIGLLRSDAVARRSRAPGWSLVPQESPGP